MKTETTPAPNVPESIKERAARLFKKARDKRSPWESHLDECYEFALPQRGRMFTGGQTPGGKRTDRLFDGTAPDSVDQLAASMLAKLTPPWGKWFDAELTGSIPPETATAAAVPLEAAADRLRRMFADSNFAVEIHQCYLDLVVGGTASLHIERADERMEDTAAPFRFTALPRGQVWLLEDEVSGLLNHTFRTEVYTLPSIKRRWPNVEIPADWEKSHKGNPETMFTVLEAELPAKAGGYDAILLAAQGGTADCVTIPPAHLPGGVDGMVELHSGRRRLGRYIHFRWLKAPGEIYGRSPVMKALPDIKTANKVVELVLKNAAIAVTGIWQCDDDGVINPAAVRLVPGTVIPKAVGSSGLTPLESPGRFDVSQIILDQLRARIQRALLTDQLGQVDGPRMTATEVLERAAEMARILGATYGRLQQEMLQPIVSRASEIAIQSGALDVSEVAAAVDIKAVRMRHMSPLARDHQIESARNVGVWLEAINNGLGPDGAQAVHKPETARWLGEQLGVPVALTLTDAEIAEAMANAREQAAADMDTAETIKAGGKQLASAPPPPAIPDPELIQ